MEGCENGAEKELGKVNEVVLCVFSGKDYVALTSGY